MNVHRRAVGRRLWIGAMALGLAGIAPAQGPPSPFISGLSPSQVGAGSPTFQMDVMGSNFAQNAVVLWNRTVFSPGDQLSTQWLSPSLLRAMVPAAFVQQAGSFPIAVQQTITGGAAITQTSNSVTFTVVPGLTISTPCPLPNAVVNQPYNVTLQASGGAPPYFWEFEGTLPTGISMNATGSISGTPLAAGQSQFILYVYDGQERMAQRACSLNVVTSQQSGHAIFSLFPSTVLAGSPAVNLIVNGQGFREGAQVIWSPGSGETRLETTLVSPVRLNAVIPQALLRTQGEFPLVVRQPQSLTAPPVDSEPAIFTVAEQLQITTTCPLREVALNQPFNDRFIAVGGFTPYTWDLAGGELPPGITLNNNGSIGGTPTTPGRFSFTVRVTDQQSNVVTRACSQVVLGPISAFPSTLTFVADGTGRQPDPQPVGVTAVGDSVMFAANPNVSWIRVARTSDQTPATVYVQVDRTGLTTGVHRGILTLNSERASNRAVTVEVTVRVDAPEAARMAVQPGALRFLVTRGSAAAPRQALRVLNLGSGAINFTAQAATARGGNWLSITPAAGTATAAAPGLVRVAVNPERLNPGVYRGNIAVRGNGQEINVPVTLGISQSPDGMTLSQSGMLFTVAAGSSPPPPQRFEVAATGAGGFFWDTAVSTLSGGSWLRVDPPSNSSQPGAPSGAAVVVDPAGLPPDLYFGEVAVRAGVDNSPRLLSVVLQVLAAGATPPPVIEPGGLVFTTSPGGPLPPPKAVLVRNMANQPATVSFQLTGTPQNLFSAGSAAPITVPPGGTRRIEVLANTSALAAGAYRGVLAVHVGGDGRVRLVDLLAVVGPGIPAAARKQGERQAAGCVPTRLLPVSTMQTVGFLAPTGLPLPLEVKVLDDCGDPMTAGAVVTSFSGSQSPVSLVHLADGRWSGTWQAQGSTGAVTATITADDPVRNLQGSIAMSGELQPTQGVPVVSEGGVVSAAAIALGAPLAPGGIFSAFGANLADGSNAVTGFPVPTQLSNARVAIAGRESPLFFAGPTQINGMFPYDLTPNTSYQLSVRRGNRRSNYIEVVMAGAQPSVFTASQTGSGQGSIVDGAQQTVLADAANPVARGGVVVIYLEGLGAVNRAVTPGEPAPGGPLAEAVAPVSVTIGGQPAQVLFAGLTPGFTGLYQVNASVPDNITPGNAVPVVVTAGDQTSPAVTIAVR